MYRQSTRYTLCTLMILLFIGATQVLQAQSTPTPKPSYCDDFPDAYSSTRSGAGVTPPPPLPKFNTTPTTEYKVQVAILKYSDPRSYPFHDKLVARFRPCEQVWVVESRETFKTKAQAERLKEELRVAGYSGCYVVDIIGYQ